MHENRKTLLLALGFLLLGPPLAAQGEIVTWAMEGTIQSVTDPLGLIGFAQVEEHVLYTFTFDRDTPDTNPTTTSATYLGSAATFAVGTTSFPAAAPQIDIQRHPSFHANDLFNVSSGLQVEGMPGSVYFRLRDPLGTALTDTALPPQPCPLASFAGAGFSASVSGPPSPGNPSGTLLSFTGSVDAFYAMPEPCSLMLFAMATMAFAIRRELGSVRSAD